MLGTGRAESRPLMLVRNGGSAGGRQSEDPCFAKQMPGMCILAIGCHRVLMPAKIAMTVLMGGLTRQDRSLGWEQETVLEPEVHTEPQEVSAPDQPD